MVDDDYREAIFAGGRGIPGSSPRPAARAHMLKRLAEIATARLGPDRFRVDPVMRRIPDHFHAHARDPTWWGFHRG